MNKKFLVPPQHCSITITFTTLPGHPPFLGDVSSILESCALALHRVEQDDQGDWHVVVGKSDNEFVLVDNIRMKIGRQCGEELCSYMD